MALKMEKTFIHIEFWQLVGFLLSFLGICFTFGKMLLAQFREQQDERQKQQERLQGKVEIMAYRSHNCSIHIDPKTLRKEDIMSKIIRLTETVLRDGQQSQIATRISTEDMCCVHTRSGADGVVACWR